MAFEFEQFFRHQNVVHCDRSLLALELGMSPNELDARVEKSLELTPEARRCGLKEPTEEEAMEWVAMVAGRALISPRWLTLRKLCGTLEALALKQSRGEPASEEDRRFFCTYGRLLGNVMLHDYDGAFWPEHDDSPRITCLNDRFGASGRPQAIYVLEKGKLYLGSVMPYVEFSDGDSWDNERWQERLLAGEKPRPPDWLAPLSGGDAGGATRPAAVHPGLW